MQFQPHTPQTNTRPTGFTLVEMMIAVAIVGLLVALALPSYQNHLAKGHRADARTQLLLAAQFMQRFYAANDSFKQDRATPPNEVLTQIPGTLRQSPASGTALYELSLPADTLDDLKFTLKMSPIQGEKMANDACGAFTLTSTDIKANEVGGTAASTTLRNACWN